MLVRAARIDDASAIAKVHTDTWRTTYSGIVPEAYIAQLSYEKREVRWVQMLSTSSDDHHFIYVAEANGQIVGFADGGLKRTRNPVYQGELYAIYVLAPYQRQGIGRQLTLSVALRLSQLGLNSLLVWVLADNPACKFYQALGGVKVDEQQINIGGVMLAEVAYGWMDVNVLLAKA